MSPVWQPVQKPPQLDKFCHLSHDAQIVMVALHRKYLERKEEILHSKTQLPDASDYYRAMYAEKFGVCAQRQYTDNGLEMSSLPSSESVLTQSVDCTESSGIKTIQSTSSIIQQTTENTVSCSGINSVQLPSRIRQRTTASLERQNMCSTPLRTRNHFGSRQYTPKIQQPLCASPSKIETCRALFPDMKSTGTKELSFANNTVKNNKLYPRTMPHEMIGSMDSLERKTSVGSEKPWHESPLRREKCAILPVNGNIGTDVPGSPSLFSQDCDGSTGKPVINDESNIASTESFINHPGIRYQEELKNINASKSVPESTQNMESINTKIFRFSDKTEKPGLSEADKQGPYETHHVAEKFLKRNDGTKQCEALNTALVRSTPRPCSITERLDDHRKIRQLFSKENSGLLKQSTIDSHGKIKKKSNATTFEIPFKKKRMEPEKSVGKHMTLISTSEIDVGSLSSHEMDNVADLIIKSDEVVISLIYKDGATQLREKTSCPPNKRKMNSTKLHSSEEVSSVAVMPKITRESNKVHVYKFHLENKEEILYNWNRNFWENFLYSTNRKICYKAKDFLNTVIKIFNLEQTNVSTECSVLDPMVAAWLLDPDKNAMEFNEALTVFRFQCKEVVDVHPAEMLKEDLHLLSKLMERLYQELKNKELWQLFYYVENRLVSLLAVMELRRIKINTDELVRFSEVLKKKIIKLEKKAHLTVGHSFLLNSHAQLRQVLFEELNLASKLPQKTKLAKTNVGHQTSTSESVLNQLVDFHPLPSIVLEHRQIQKLKSTYIDGMMSCVRDGYISTHWDQTSAATGRLSSYQPNVQAIPKTPVIITDYEDNFIIGKENSSILEIYARDPFISHEGWSFLAADFQQIELRILAHLSNDPSLLKIFQQNKNGDIFLELAAQWLNKSVKDVTLSDREQTKRVVYSVMYGAGKEKLAEYLKISPENAKAIINSFLVKFPAVNQLTRKCIEFCQKNGYTKTIFKRRRNFPNINHCSPPIRAQTERQAFNFCLQGSAADLCKAAMLQIELALRKNQNVKARLLVQIHDELLLEVADEDLSTVQEIVRTVMEDDKGLCGDMVELKVPLKISLNVGKTWGHMTPV